MSTATVKACAGCGQDFETVTDREYCKPDCGLDPDRVWTLPPDKTLSRRQESTVGKPAAVLNRVKSTEPPQAPEVVPEPDPVGMEVKRPLLVAIDGTRKITRDGYATVKTNLGAIVAEHRVVMEAKLGRPLRKGESVHHVNGVRDDNRPENLELWVGPIRRGVRAADLRCPNCGEVWQQRAA